MADKIQHAESREQLRALRLAAYDRLREQRPELFENPSGAAYEIVFDPALQEAVADESAAEHRANGTPEQYGDIGIVYQDRYMTLIRDAVRFRSGRLGSYIRSIPTSDTVTAGAAVLSVHGGRVILLRHFRHASRRWHWELPRGFGIADEDPEATARREVNEELGADVTKIEHLGALGDSGGSPGDLPQIYWAEITEPTALESEEGIDDTLAATPAELDRMMVAGELDDGFTLAAIAYARARGLLA